VIVADAREIRAITGSDRKSDQVDAEKVSAIRPGGSTDFKATAALRRRGTGGSAGDPESGGGGEIVRIRIRRRAKSALLGRAAQLEKAG